MTFKVKSANLKAKNSQGLELAVVILQNNGRKDLYAIKLVEWRHLLCYGHIEFDIELAPYYHEAIGNLPCAGILSLKLQLSPISQLNLVTERAINAEMEL